MAITYIGRECDSRRRTSFGLSIPFNQLIIQFKQIRFIGSRGVILTLNIVLICFVYFRSFPFFQNIVALKVIHVYIFDNYPVLKLLNYNL